MALKIPLAIFHIRHEIPGLKPTTERSTAMSKSADIKKEPKKKATKTMKEKKAEKKVKKEQNLAS